MTYIRLSKGTLAELPVLERFQKLGYEVRASPEISPGGEHPERKSYIESVLNAGCTLLWRDGTRICQMVEALIFYRENIINFKRRLLRSFGGDLVRMSM